MSKKKISKANRKFFLKWLPFNFCDRFCERCEEFRDECKVYQDEMRFRFQCQLEGRDPYDTKVVFEYVGQRMAQTIAMLYQIMEKEGIKITKEDEKKYKKEQEMEEEKVKSHPLYRKCWALSADFRRFLENFWEFFEERPWILVYLQNEIEEICFYCHLIAVKAIRALYSQIEEQKERIKFPRPDSLVSGSLGYYSLITCQGSLESILNIMKDVEKSWVPKVNQLLESIEEAKKEFKKTFPEVENYQDKIIFHGRFLN